mgnify:CR=1 FL=1
MTEFHVSETVEPPEKIFDVDNWVCWRTEQRDGKETKPPLKPYHDPMEHDYAQVNSGDEWRDYETARDYAMQADDVEGVGFVFDEDSVLMGIDLDDVRDPETGETVEWAAEVIDTLASFTEVSPSGTGYHIYTVGIKPGDSSKNMELPGHDGDNEADLEMYDKGRFFTFTGQHVEGTPTEIKQRASAVREVYDEYLADDDDDDDDNTTDAPTDGTDLEDDDLLDRARNAENGDKFERLFDRGDLSAHGGDHSVADLALCQMLAFWTGGDRQRIDSLFRNSALMRDKWDDVHSGDGDTYGEMTIDQALSRQTEFYDPDDSNGNGSRSGGGGGDGDGDGNSTSGGDDGDDDDSSSAGRSWDRVYNDYWDANDDAIEQFEARQSAVEALKGELSFATDRATDVLYSYDPERGIFEPHGESKVRELLSKNLREHYTAHEKNEVVSRLKGLSTYKQDEFGGPEWHINARNGVLDVDDESLKDHAPDYLYRAGSPVEFDPEADCPTWREFLKDVTSNKTDRMLLQEFAGYTLMHWDYPWHKALFLVGPGASGKSTFLDTIRNILGSEAVASVTPHELGEERFAGVELHGRWANIRNDIPSEMIENTGKFKEIVAGDPIKVEEKYQDTFTIEPNAKHLYSTNQLPDASVDDDAFYRRILLVSFPSTVPRSERDPHLFEKLEDEFPGILNWMIDGLKRLVNQGKFTGDEPPEQTRQTWESWGSSIKKFKQDCLEKDKKAAVPKSDVYAAYRRWCEENGLPTKTQQKMTRIIKQDPDISDGRRNVDGKRQRCYTGVNLLEERVPQPDDDDDGDTRNDGLDSY